MSWITGRPQYYPASGDSVRQITPGLRLALVNWLKHSVWLPEGHADGVVALVTWPPRRVNDKVGDVGNLPALRARPVEPDGAAAACVSVAAPVRLVDVILVAPTDQRPNRRPEPSALWRQHVLVTAAGARCSPKHAFVNQQGKSLGENRFRDAEMGTKVTEPAYAVKGIPYNQQRPPLADDLE